MESEKRIETYERTSQLSVICSHRSFPHQLFAIPYSLFATPHSPLATLHSLLATRHSLLSTRHSPPSLTLPDRHLQRFPFCHNSHPHP